jgi:hypothetical protein
VLVEFNKPSEINTEEYLVIPAESNWNDKTKFCIHSINKFSVHPPFFSSGNVRSYLPICMHPLNDETYKSAVIDFLKCVNDTNLQCHYVGDCVGSVELAGLGLPSSALTDGTLPGSEVLFKCCLCEVKALYDSQLYLKI